MKKQPIPNSKNKPATKLPPKERIEKDPDDLVHGYQDDEEDQG